MAETDKKICFFINSLGVGGAEKVFVEDANSFAKMGYTVFFVVLYGDRNRNLGVDQLLINNENIIFLEAENIFDFNAYGKLRSLLKKLGAVTLYSTLNDAVFVSRFVALGLSKVRLVTRESNTAEYKSFKLKFFDLFMNARVEKMIVVSEEVGKSLLSYEPWYKHKISVVYNSVEIENPLERNTETNVLLSVGSLTPKKSHVTLIEAFPGVLSVFPTATLRIVGDGVLRPHLEALIAEKGLKEKVILLGKMTPNEVKKEYKKASVFVLSSIQEGCPNVLLEALSFSLPSVASRVGAVPEIIEDGVSGFVVPKQNSSAITEKVVEFLKSESLRESVGSAGRSRMQKMFSKDKHIESLKQILFT